MQTTSQSNGKSSPSTSKYAPSPPATHASRTIFRNFEVKEVGRVAATEHNVAAIIDYATQLYRVVPKLDAVVRSAPWTDREALKHYLDRMRDAVLALEEVSKRMPRYANQTPAEDGVYQISASALQAARLLSQQFRFFQRAKIRATEKNLAILIDVCTSAFRIEAVIRRLTSSQLWLSKNELMRDITQVRKALRATEIVKNRTPSAPASQVVELHPAPKEEQEIRLTREQRKEVEKFARLVEEARTVQEQQALLQKAGLVSHSLSSVKEVAT
jgi:hypothetical protein